MTRADISEPEHSVFDGHDGDSERILDTVHCVFWCSPTNS